jgi:hypothetical protein
MGSTTGILSQLRDLFWADPLRGVAVAAAVIALATTPIAFAVLGRMDYLQTRRGRTYRRPSWPAVVCGMVLVMGIPCIFLALVVKSQYFDKNRYEFDPNQTWTIIEQGRGYRTPQELNEAIRAEMQRLANERKNLVENVKKLDEAMLGLRAVAGQAPAVAQAMPIVLQRLAGVRQSVGVDGPQQLLDFTAPPAALPTTVPTSIAVAPTPTVQAPSITPVAPGGGLTRAEVDAELASVPEPQRPLAAMLPLADLPTGWTAGKSGSRHLESFNAENLFEKIDGRAESFIQYDVRGMTYAYYHPAGDESNEVQVYIFEMGSPLKALGKYGSEKPDDAKTVPIGSEGYTTAGSTLFYADRYYTQIVSTQDDATFAAFALELAKRIAARQAPAETLAAPAEGPGQPKAVTPEALFALLPVEPKKSGTKYVAQDVFGYSFLSDVFMADYQAGDTSWQGFLRPYPDTAAAQKVFDQYLAEAKANEAELKTVAAEGADRMVVSQNFGLVDVLFLKGNAVGGANGATEAGPAEAFARAFVKGLPKTVPYIEPEKTPTSGDAAGSGNEKN